MLTYACLVRGCSLSEGSREMEREEESSWDGDGGEQAR